MTTQVLKTDQNPRKEVLPPRVDLSTHPISSGGLPYFLRKQNSNIETKTNVSIERWFFTLIMTSYNSTFVLERL